MDRISQSVRHIPPSGIREFFELVIGTKGVISLGVGEPDFSTPWNISESAIFSIEEGQTSYTSNKGLYPLREGISRFLRHKYRLSYDPDREILVTSGVSEAMDLALRALLNPGDRVLIPDPYYVSYYPLVVLAGGQPVFVRTERTGFKLTPELIEKCVDGRTKAVIINYPANPTGVSYTRKELAGLARVFAAHDLTVISDEIYGELTYDFDHTPLSGIRGMKGRTVYLDGFSKAFAMTGWRVGFSCGPEDIISAMTKIHQYSMLCAPTISQIGAIEALRGSTQRSVQDMKREYRRRRDFVVSELNEMGLRCPYPHGTFYAFPSIENTGLGCIEFAKRLLKQEKVAVVPGNAFGSEGKKHIRISYASGMDDLREAMSRIRRFLKKNEKR